MKEEVLKNEYYFCDTDFMPNNNIPVNISGMLVYFNLTIFLILA